MILLTDKDADFIANIARRELERTRCNFNEIMKLIEAEKKNVEKKITLLNSEELRNEYREKSEATYTVVQDNLGKYFLSVIQDYIKIIDLATTGSKLLEDKNE